MRAPRCKTCDVEHWGVCYTPPAVVKAKIAAIPAKKPPAKKPAAKKPAKPKASKPNGKA